MARLRRSGREDTVFHWIVNVEPTYYIVQLGKQIDKLSLDLLLACKFNPLSY